MENEFDYNAIRPYHDDEVPGALERLTAEPQVQSVLKYAYPDKPVEEVISYLRSLKTVYDFQSQVVGPFFLNMAKKSAAGLDIAGLDRVNPDEKYLYISNHRDIILDAALLNSLMINHGIDTAENAAGDNLCVMPWITDAMKLNKNFIVQRSGSNREIFEASKRLSYYIRRNIVEKRSSVWIAQREGRAKNSDDRTQESLLKMLTMSAGKNLKESFVELNIFPISISYEYDACDFLKAKEFQQKRDNPEYTKSKEDDLLNMQTGMTGYKGRIHYELSGTISEELYRVLGETDDRATLLEKIAAIIDCKIHQNYKIFPGNYAALDALCGEYRFLHKTYTEEEKQVFDAYIEKQIAKIDLPQKDVSFLREKLLEMYANPLINHLKAMEE